MTSEWLILHGGALGDLVLTIQLALRLPGTEQSGALHVVSRVDPGDLSSCRPSIVRQAAEGLGLHWLFGDHDDPPPARLRQLVQDRRALSGLSGRHTIVHQRLAELKPAALHSLDPRPRAGIERHITEQWRIQLESQGLLVPKCVHQRPAQRGLGVPAALREHGRALLSERTRNRAMSAAGECENVVLIHPGSGGKAKCWPLASFVAVGRLLRESARSAVCFMIGPVEAETWPAAALAALADEFAVIRCPPPDELVALLAAARAFVGNDAGPGHLAALLGTPTVAIFGATSANVWHPLGTDVQVVVGDPEQCAVDWGLKPEDVAARVHGEG